MIYCLKNLQALIIYLFHIQRVYSGGIDSTLLALLAQEALLGESNVPCLMPHLSQDGLLKMQQILPANSDYPSKWCFSIFSKMKSSKEFSKSLLYLQKIIRKAAPRKS